jgi:hypothetical protein
MGGCLHRFSAFLHNKTPLQRIVAARGFFGGLRRSISREFTDETNLIGAVSQFQSVSTLHPFILTTWIAILALAYINKNESEELDADFSKWLWFYDYERKARLIVVIFASVMTKNIDNAI